MRSPGVLWSHYDWANDGSVGVFFRHGNGFRSIRGVSAPLGNGYEIQGQNYVASLQGRVL